MQRIRNVSTGSGNFWIGNPTVLVLVGVLLIALTELSHAAPVRIVGDAQMELFNTATHSSRVVESNSLVIVVDGSRFNLSSKSVGGYNFTEDYGSDGTDLFMISDRGTPFNRDGKGVTGFAFPGRFPSDLITSPIIQAVWLGYCSEGYFQNPSNRIGLPLSFLILPLSPPDWVTNIVTYAKDSNLPAEIKGWSRRWINVRGVGPVEYQWYPSSGFKVWEFRGSNYVTLGQSKFPRQITLTAFTPDPSLNNTNAHAGEDVIPLRRITFVANSIEVQKESFDPLPVPPVAELPVMDDRFTNMSGRFQLVSHISSFKWPTRGSPGINDALAEARKMALENERPELKLGVPRTVAIMIIALNLAVVIWISRVVLKKKSKSANQSNI